ncbi:uncharacterized protein LOC128386970 [Panonychus citri]|uniref:uncharacterized protein LOC128386970 n=1 Tax=Panonychus citri TaxID=50023 RepID=UPI0023081004|nr:uncharacterized protein LOC128386970 [Panonychus citri]
MEDQFILLENNNVTIVNREKSYEISKQKLSSIPYFVKLFSDPNNCDLAEIELDLDESSFDNIVDFILNNHLSISMESAFSMIETADYLGMYNIKQKYYDCLESNFNIDQLEEFLDFYENRKCSEKLNSFIAKFFVPISNTRAFLKFPVALIELILKMNLVVSLEYQIVEAIDRWIKFDEKARAQYLLPLMEFINLFHCNNEIQTVWETVLHSEIQHYIPGLQELCARTCTLKLCQSDCKNNRRYNKSLVSIYELDRDKINIRRLSSSNLWTNYSQFIRDETISSSLIEADHIVDIIYDSGRKGIRVDLIGKKFKYLKMFGNENSYYGKVHKHITHDIEDPEFACVKINDSTMKSNLKKEYLNIRRLEAISLNDHLDGICYGNEDYIDSIGLNSCHDEPDEYDDNSTDQYYYCRSLNYRKLALCSPKGPVRTRSCLFMKPNDYSGSTKSLYFLTKREFCRMFFEQGFPDDTYVLDHSFLKDFIGSGSLNHIELISHNNSVLICNKEKKMIYSYIEDTDHWKFMSKIESPEKMVTIASICWPIDFE